MDQQLLAADRFGSKAANYLTSTIHASGADLDRLAALGQDSQGESVLDLGCGAGHASFALARGGARRVVAYDISAQMLAVVAAEARGRGYAQIETRVGAAERLAFDDASFDRVVTRYSAHHWLDVGGALREAVRTLKKGGTLVVIDVLAPESPLMDTVLQTVEMLRDPSHVRDYRESEWRALFESTGCSAPRVDRWRLPLEFDGWVARIGSSDARIAALKVVFDELPNEAREYFAVTPERSFSIDAGWLSATRA
ncbi:MAG: class I SAM-dependent methyltransferase [Pseudomonadota bacterium]|nr:class I SAM-dependent methyltransferase [Pseudomonadota bacterium]